MTRTRRAVRTSWMLLVRSDQLGGSRATAGNRVDPEVWEPGSMSYFADVWMSSDRYPDREWPYKAKGRSRKAS